ncbi:MAG: hypothetical protein FWE37_03230 [Spirochaetaceae bacterium]|nr:hypothetical protein [Spirochaetaceae bacterium]
MLLFAITLVPLLVGFCLCFAAKDKRLAVIWGAVLGVLSAVFVSFIILFVINILGFSLNWASSPSIFFYYSVSDFLLPIVLITLNQLWLNSKNYLAKGLPSLSFFGTAYILVALQRLLWFSHYFSYYEVIFFPLAALAASFVVSNLLSRQPLKFALVLTLIFALLLSFVPFFAMINRLIMATILTTILAVLCVASFMLLGLLKDVKHN